MTVNTTAFDAVFGSDPLGRFTAAVVTTVPEFDPSDTPIGHALAESFFHREDEPPAIEPVEAVLVPERVYEWPTIDEPVRRPSPRPRLVEEPSAGEESDASTGTVLELPLAASTVEWFGITTEPDEEIDEPELRAG